MSNRVLFGDAWIREAEEASRLIEDIETRIKNNNPEQRLGDHARRKLMELGPKLDRLESLLRNPPAKPILTDQDLNDRWSMLLEIQLRTKAIAVNLYAIQFSTSPESLHTADLKETVETISSRDKDYTMLTFTKQDHELLVPLVKTDDATRNQLQRRQSSSLLLKGWVRETCWIIFLVIGATFLVFILVIVCAVI